MLEGKHRSAQAMPSSPHPHVLFKKIFMIYLVGILVSNGWNDAMTHIYVYI